jgi:hypothetical protein
MSNTYPHKETIVSLCQKLHLPYPDSFEQDWQYVVVDPNRIQDFLWLYQTDTQLSDNEKMTLGMLIIGSLNEALDRGEEIDSIWETSWNELQADVQLHDHTLRYWACLDEEDSSNWFPIAQRVRSVIID